jgi:hypothetical protein
MVCPHVAAAALVKCAILIAVMSVASRAVASEVALSCQLQDSRTNPSGHTYTYPVSLDLLIDAQKKTLRVNQKLTDASFTQTYITWQLPLVQNYPVNYSLNRNTLELKSAGARTDIPGWSSQGQGSCSKVQPQV